MKIRNAFRTTLAAAAVLATMGSAVQAQDFPSKAVRMVVPFPAGGTLDTLGRMMSPRMQEKLGQPIVIEPRPGGATRVGTQAVQTAAPDGHSLLFMANSFVIVPMMMAKAPWDPLKDFVPVSLVSQVTQALVVHPGFEAKTLPEMVKYAKARPGQLDFASFGNGTSSHLGVELFKSISGIFMVHIPYQGMAPALQNVLGGQVKVFLANIPDVLPHVRGNRLRALAVADEKRSPLMPETPTFAEQGYPGYIVFSWYGLVAPAGTPDTAVRKIQEAVAFALAGPDLRERLVQQGHTIVGSAGDDLRRFMQGEQKRYAEPIRRSGAKIE